MDRIGYNDVYAAFENLLDVMNDNGLPEAVVDVVQNELEYFTENTIITEDDDED